MGLRKVYEGKQRVVAVDGIDLHVGEGEIYGLLGPNGAGKTTTISICTTRAVPTEGVVKIAGIDVCKQPALARRCIGVVPQYNTLDRACTISENIFFHCRYFGFSTADAKARTAQLLEQFHLAERAKAYPQQLSGGLAQRVQIARAIAHRPKVLFLDEPSAGLDPQSRIAMWEAVSALRHEGITVVLTTHYMEEADELCDRVAIIDHGKILVQDTPAALKSSVGAKKMIDPAHGAAGGERRPRAGGTCGARRGQCGGHRKRRARVCAGGRRHRGRGCDGVRGARRGGRDHGGNLTRDRLHQTDRKGPEGNSHGNDDDRNADREDNQQFQHVCQRVRRPVPARPVRAAA